MFVVREKQKKSLGFSYAAKRKVRLVGSSPVGTTFVPSALRNAVQGILARLYSDFHLNTKSRDELIRKRRSEGEGLSVLARAFGISPQRVYQIVHYK